MKNIYEAPKFEELGLFESMTQGASASPLLDDAQPANTLPIVGFS